MSKTIHLTAAIPYINGKPHLGHVLEWFQADASARYYRQLGYDVSFTCGTDENSLKNVQAAEKAGVTPQAWLDEYSEIFRQAFEKLDISLTGFRRGSDAEKHWPGVQKLWQLCDASGDIYKKTYQGLYCVGCEAFYTPNDLVDGKCPEHLTEPEVVKEENYFFRLSKYEQQIRDLIATDKLRVISDRFKNEMLGFIDQGLEDFSVSRSVERARGVGVPVPGDDKQIMYVWFDALCIYMTAIGWGYDVDTWQKFWANAETITHVIGKGINRFHSVYWIGMLLSASQRDPQLRLPTTISVHGYITADGQKMSKSLGNVIDPFEAVTEYGLEPIRYYLLKEIPTHNDGDFSRDRFAELYTADLSNGIGNLCSRVAKLAEKAGVGGSQPPEAFHTDFVALMDELSISDALQWVVDQVAATDQFLSETTPWKLEGDVQKTVLTEAIQRIVTIAYHLQPFLPKTSNQILTLFTQQQITALSPLFPRLS